MDDTALVSTEGRSLAETRPDTSSLLNFVAQAVNDPNIDVTKLEALLRMQREVEAEQARNEFNVALHDAQAEMPRVRKNGTVELGTGKGSYAFARWEDMDTALRPLMEKHGFTLSFDMTGKDGGGAIIKGTLLHVRGHSMSKTIPLALDTGPGRNNLQAMGSTLSYGKRYLAEMLFNIVREGEDDDGKIGGTKFISPERVAEIDQKLTATKRDRDGFLQLFELARIENMNESQYVAARNMLNIALERMPKQ